MRTKALTILGLIAIGVLGRLLPHMPNATPVTAIALAGSKYVGRVWAIVIPITAMLISDALIGFYDWRILVSVYASFALIGAMSMAAKKHPGIIPAGLFAIGASLIFFFLTNFAVWALSPWYERSLWGLLYCYELGLPFLRNMLLGDLLYTATILGACGLLRSRAPRISAYRRAGLYALTSK